MSSLPAQALVLALVLASLGLNSAPLAGTRFAFNLTARKPAGDLWLMWRGTQGNSFLVENAGILEIGP